MTIRVKEPCQSSLSFGARANTFELLSEFITDSLGWPKAESTAFANLVEGELSYTPKVILTIKKMRSLHLFSHPIVESYAKQVDNRVEILLVSPDLLYKTEYFPDFHKMIKPAQLLKFDGVHWSSHSKVVHIGTGQAIEVLRKAVETHQMVWDMFKDRIRLASPLKIFTENDKEEEDSTPALIVYQKKYQTDLNKEMFSGKERIGFRKVAKYGKDLAAMFAITARECYLHHDIKPANIFLDDLDNAVIADLETFTNREEILNQFDKTYPFCPRVSFAFSKSATRLVSANFADVFGLTITLMNMLLGNNRFWMSEVARDKAELKRKWKIEFCHFIGEWILAKIQKIDLQQQDKITANFCTAIKDLFYTIFSLDQFFTLVKCHGSQLLLAAKEQLKGKLAEDRIVCKIIGKIEAYHEFGKLVGRILDTEAKMAVLEDSLTIDASGKITVEPSEASEKPNVLDLETQDMEFIKSECAKILAAIERNSQSFEDSKRAELREV